jgi:hypothetical protein
MALPADPTSVIGRRIGAVLIDGAVVLGPSIAVLTADLEYLEEDELPFGADRFCEDYLDTVDDTNVCIEGFDGNAYFGEPGGGFLLTLAALTIGMYVLLQGLTGWTLGKLITGIRVVREDGSRPGLGRAAVRWLMWIVDGLPFLGLVAFITSLTTTGHRRVGDMVAKTFVVRAGAAGQPVLVPGITAPPAIAAGGVAPPPSASGPQWDEARGTYIQWDPQLSLWVQWDEATEQWRAIAGQAPPPPPPPPPPAEPPTA